MWRGVSGRGWEEEVEEHGCVPGGSAHFRKKPETDTINQTRLRYRHTYRYTYSEKTVLKKHAKRTVLQLPGTSAGLLDTSDKDRLGEDCAMCDVTPVTGWGRMVL